MKNISSSVVILFCSLIVCSLANAGALYHRDVEASDDFRRAAQALPQNSRIEVTEGQAFESAEKTVFAAGRVLNENYPGKSDCFIYTKFYGKTGQIQRVSQRAEDLWYCVGPSAVALRRYGNGDNALLALLSIFSYQAPSGELFHFPFVLQSDNSSTFYVGTLNDCAFRELSSIDLKKMRQVEDATRNCVRALGVSRKR